MCANIEGSELNLLSSVHMERQEEIPACHKATPFKYGEEDSKSKISNLTESDEDDESRLKRGWWHDKSGQLCRCRWAAVSPQ